MPTPQKNLILLFKRKLTQYISRIDLFKKDIKKSYLFQTIILGHPLNFWDVYNYILQPNLRLKIVGIFHNLPLVVPISAGAIFPSRIGIDHWTNCRVLTDYRPMVIGIAGYLLYFHVKYSLKQTEIC